MSETITKICVLTFNRPDWEKLELMANVARAKVPTMTAERVIEVVVTDAVNRWQPDHESPLELNPS